MRGDSHLKTSRHPLVSAAKYIPYRWGLNRIAAHLYVGAANRRYLRHYGVPERRLFFAPHFVENDRFAASAGSARASGEVQAMRASIGAGPEVTVFLFAGKLIEKKRPADFVAALAELARRGVRAVGAVVGSGPLQPSLEAQAQAGGVDLRWLGFKNQTEIPACYAAADCLVLPSDGRETWGLVVNEAMACGRPAIVSDAVGCAEDLIEPGRTGDVYPVGHAAALADRMAAMANRLAHHRAEVKDAVRARIGRYTCEAAVSGTLEALGHVTQRLPVARTVLIKGAL
jgi:glycosyltransferase involved in cell wall biosynthesis